MKQIPDSVFEQMRRRVDYNAERRVATKIFRALALSRAHQDIVRNYCLVHNITPSFSGHEPEAAVFALKAVLLGLRNNMAALNVSEYVLGPCPPDHYGQFVYPRWTGAVTAAVDEEGLVTYAVHQDRLLGVPMTFCSQEYEGECGTEPIYQITQSLEDYVSIRDSVNIVEIITGG